MITAKEAFDLSNAALQNKEPFQNLEERIKQSILYACNSGVKEARINVPTAGPDSIKVELEDLHKIIHIVQAAGYELRFDTSFEKVFTYTFVINWERSR